jgi:hypothetical protein
MSLVIVLIFSLTDCGGPEKPKPAVKPAPQAAKWEVLGPGGGGSTYIPTFNPSNPEKVLIRCDMTGTYVSADGGNSWEMFNFPGGSDCIAFDPSDTATIYVGSSGLYRSNDGGKSWKLLFPDPAAGVESEYLGDHADFSFKSRDNFPKERNSSVTAVCVDPSNSDQIFIGINHRLFCSEDYGKKWVMIGELDGSIINIYAPGRETQEMTVFTGKSIYRVDKKTKKLVLQPLPPEMAPLLSVACGTDSALKSFRVYALSRIKWDGKKRVGGIFISENGGAAWQQVTGKLAGGLKVRDESGGLSFSYIACAAKDSRTAYLVCSRFDALNERGEIGLWYGVFKTGDAGNNWKWVYKAGGGSADYTVRDGWTAGNERDSWVREAFGGEYISAINVGVFPGDGDIAIFTDWYRAMKTVDGGANWEEIYSERLPDSSVRSRGLDVTTSYGVHFDPFNKDHIAISYTDIGFFHSYNRGRSWTRSVNGVPPAWDNTCYWMVFDPGVKDRLWSAWSSWHDIPRLKMVRNESWKKYAVGGVCVSTDGGATWKVSSDGLPENSPTTCIVLDPGSPQGSRTLYMSVFGQGVFKSVDDGKSWKKKNAGLGENLSAWELTLSPNGSLYLVITQTTKFENGRILPELAYGEIYRSGNQAETWEKLSLPSGIKFPNSLCVDPADPLRLYVACWATLEKGDIFYGRVADSIARARIEADGGVFVSEDGGGSWKSIFDKKAYVYSVAVDSGKPGRLYLNTFTNAAYLSDDYGKTWKKLQGYDFEWGHRAIIDRNDPEMIYLTTFGGSVFHGRPVAEE